MADMYDPATQKWTTLAALPKARYASRALMYDNDTILITGGQCDNNPTEHRTDGWFIIYILSTNTYRTLPWSWRADPYTYEEHTDAAPIRCGDGSIMMSAQGVQASQNYSFWWLPADRVDIHRTVEWHHWYRLPNVPSDEIFAIFPWD
jgi:hypothetical protein